jgi:hypothetical protein
MTLRDEAGENFKEQNLRLWEQKLHSLFPEGIPADHTWFDRADIVRVLATIGEENLNHLFFPQGGSLDLSGAADSYEADCIELHFGSRTDIVKPDHLAFHSFGPEVEWSYFRLETLPLAPSGIYERSDQAHEELLELAPGHYEDSAAFAVGYYGDDEAGNPQPLLPNTARRVIRHFGGSFVIFAKAARYNSIPTTYFAQHNKMNAAKFKAAVEQAVEKLRKRRRA